MERGNTQSHDAAVQQLLDLMQIPAENRPAAAAALLQLIKSQEWQSQWTAADAEKRCLRILELCNKLLKELDGVPPALHFFVCEPASSKAIGNLAKMLPFKTRTERPAHRPSGFKNYRLFYLITALFKFQKEHGGRLTLTKSIPSGKPSGSLPATLKIFHGLVPSIVPSRIAYSTLNRMRRSALDKL